MKTKLYWNLLKKKNKNNSIFEGNAYPKWEGRVGKGKERRGETEYNDLGYVRDISLIQL